MAMFRAGVMLAAASISFAACVSDSPDSLIVGSAERGAVAVKKRACDGCHEPDMGGRLDRFSDNTTNYPDTISYAANLTPDIATGLGRWTYLELDAAIRVGYDGVDKPMCEPMPVYSTMPDQELADIIAYLRSVPAISRAIPESSCPSQHGDPHDE
jgi:cytochrome c2